MAFMYMMTLMHIITTLTRKSEKHEQHLFECADKVVSCSKKTNKINRQQIVFTMHSTTNHDMAALKTN